MDTQQGSCLFFPSSNATGDVNLRYSSWIGQLATDSKQFFFHGASVLHILGLSKFCFFGKKIMGTL